MEFSEIQILLRRHRNVVAFAALVMLAAGLDLLLNPLEEGLWILSLPFVVGAAFLLAALFWPSAAEARPQPVEETLAHRFLDRVTFGGKLVPYFPVGGIVIIALDVVYNAFFSPNPALQIHDTVAILFGMSLVAYPFVPQRFDRERDFVLLFFFVLALILVLPLALVRLFSDNLDEGVNRYSATLLAPELQFMLRLLGIPTLAVPDPAGSSAPGLQFTTQGGDTVSVVITTSCSGIYSFSIFAAAFTAFILTEFRKTDRRVWALLVLGFVAAYFANLLRMTVIVAAGYFTNSSTDAMNAMLIAHSNAGWLIFLGWISLFWLLMFRFLFPRNEQRKEPVARPVAVCGICLEPLSPTILGTKCECGKLYHTSCIDELGQCPSCHRVILRPEVQSKPLA